MNLYGISMQGYTDFELSVKKVGNYYRVDVETPHGRICEEIDLNSTPEPLEIPRAHVLKENTITEYGTKLFSSFITRNIKTIFDTSYETAKKEGKILKFFLETDEESGKFFWELLYHENCFLCLNPRISFFRTIPSNLVPVLHVKPPLKILLVASNPLGMKEELNLCYERDKIKWELRYLEDSRKLQIYYTDISNAENINEKLNEGFHIFHYSGHGGLVDGIPFLVLENEEGCQKAIKVTDLQPSITGAEDMYIVIFDACALAMAAEKILQFGIPAFIGMQKSILDSAAAAFFKQFYKSLGAGETIDVAFRKSRNSVIATFGITLIDWAVPVLVLSTKNTRIFEISGEIEKEIATVNDFSGLPAISKFVGRRLKIKEIQDKIKDEDLRILLIHGYGGVGKTSLVSKVLRELQGYHIFSVVTPSTFTFGELFDGINRFLEKNSITDLNEFAERNITEKLQALVSLLCQRRIIIVLDGFEDQIENGVIKDDGMRLLLEEAIKEELKGKILVTSKITFDILGGRFSGSIRDIHLNGFQLEESLRYLRNLDVKGLDEDQMHRLHQETDGHPYALEILAGLGKKFTLEELLEDKTLYVGKIEERFVRKLLSSLKPREQETLNRCAVFDVPVPMDAFKSIGADKETISDLIDLNLIKFDREAGMYKVHSTTRDVVLSKLNNDDLGDLHMRAAQFWEKRAEETGIFWDILRAQAHYYEAKEYEKASVIVTQISESLHRWGFIRLLGHLLERLRSVTEGRVRGVILHNLGNVNLELGKYGEALFCYEESLKIAEELEDKRERAGNLLGIGNVHIVKGEYDKAFPCYKESLEIVEELGDMKGIALALNGTGNVYFYKKKYNEALLCYEKSLKIKKKLGDKTGLVGTLLAIGNIYSEREKYAKALSCYKNSLKLSEEIRYKKGIAFAHHEMSIIYLKKGNFEQALRMSFIALAVLDYLGAPETNNVVSSLQNINGKIGEEMFRELAERVTPEVKAYIRSIRLERYVHIVDT